MLFNLIPLVFVAVAAYFLWKNYISKQLDCPANNELAKGLEKKEIKETIKELEKQKKELDKEVKDLEKERKEILAGSDEDKTEKAQEKLEEKQAKVQELEKAEKDLNDLKIVESSSWKAKLPNKLSWNNGLWIGGFLIGLVILYKICVAIFRSLFRAIGWEEA
ncbi:MAG: hypothetical protein MRERV_7c071 [Mycoplasmataceae bacterium RV_VA103A]|nr:MAG: hypothetical protein MRERV_7c071 [Mycoplasmataceae bacterium RV_VA103A]